MRIAVCRTRAVRSPAALFGSAWGSTGGAKERLMARGSSGVADLGGSRGEGNPEQGDPKRGRGLPADVSERFRPSGGRSGGRPFRARPHPRLGILSRFRWVVRRRVHERAGPEKGVGSSTGSRPKEAFVPPS